METALAFSVDHTSDPSDIRIGQSSRNIISDKWAAFDYKEHSG